MSPPGHLTNYSSTSKIISSPANSPWQERGRAPAQRYADLCSCVSPPRRVRRRTGGESGPCSTIDGAGIHLDLETLMDPVMLQSGTGWSESGKKDFYRQRWSVNITFISSPVWRILIVWRETELNQNSHRRVWMISKCTDSLNTLTFLGMR